MSTTPQEAFRAAAMSDVASAYLDALRALGANLVIVAHVLALYFGIKGIPFGSLGVTIFFLLSGFLIMRSMLARGARSGPQLPGFLADRAARILTPYVPALLVIVLANLLFIEGSYTKDGTNVGVLAFLGNLLLLQDHSVFQFLELGGLVLPWRIRPYNSAEPFWTVAIEMWIYVAAGLFFFCLLGRERLARPWSIVLALVSVPVVVWNAAAGGGKSLTLIWIVGALAGALFHRWRALGYRNASLVSLTLVGFGLVALVGRAGKVGFSPYDFQTATLLGIALFGVLAYLLTVAKSMPRVKATFERLASYSYSLYLLHNTVLIVVLETVPIADVRFKAIVAVALAHVCSYLLYLGFERHYRAVAAWLRPRFEAVLRTTSERVGDALAASTSRSATVTNLTMRKPETSS